MKQLLESYASTTKTAIERLEKARTHLPAAAAEIDRMIAAARAIFAELDKAVELGARNENDAARIILVGQLDRGFGTDPDAVGPCVVAAVEGLAASGIASALKHFPGLGRVEANTDFSASGITDADTHAEDPFLDPFRAGIDAVNRLGSAQ